MEELSSVSTARTKPCRMCGEQILVNAQKCRYCGEYLTPLARRAAGKPALSSRTTHQTINSPMPYAVLAMLLFLPLGIVAIVFAAQVSSRANTGDMAGAQRAANTSEILSFISFVLGALSLLAYLAVYRG